MIWTQKEQVREVLKRIFFSGRYCYFDSLPLSLLKVIPCYQEQSFQYRSNQNDQTTR